MRHCLIPFALWLASASGLACGSEADPGGSHSGSGSVTGSGGNPIGAGGSGGGGEGGLGGGAGGIGGSGPHPCEPTLHDTQGVQADTTLQRYRLLGATEDGHRLAVLFSHFGP